MTKTHLTTTKTLPSASYSKQPGRMSQKLNQKLCVRRRGRWSTVKSIEIQILSASASLCVTNSTSSTNNPTTANNSTSSTALVYTESSCKKRRTKYENFKSTYETKLKQALTKLAEKNFTSTHLTKKQGCAILCEVCSKFHRDTQKKFNAKTALKNAIKTYPHFRDIATLKLDILTSDMFE